MSVALPGSQTPSAAGFPLRVVLRSALAVRAELARSTRHRLAFALSVVIVVGALLGDSLDAESAGSGLTAVAWCAALSLSGSSRASSGSTFFDLALLRGIGPSVVAWGEPAGRWLLAFGLHGTCSVVVGLSRAEPTRVHAALAATLGLLVVSLFACAALSALFWLAARVLPDAPVVGYWMVLLTPSLLGEAIVELEGLLEWWASVNLLILRWEGA
jgi:hypothetical protein